MQRRAGYTVPDTAAEWSLLERSLTAGFSRSNTDLPPGRISPAVILRTDLCRTYPVSTKLCAINRHRTGKTLQPGHRSVRRKFLLRRDTFHSGDYMSRA